jgi:hypothetical protein
VAVDVNGFTQMSSYAENARIVVARAEGLPIRRTSRNRSLQSVAVSCTP